MKYSEITHTPQRSRFGDVYHTHLNKADSEMYTSYTHTHTHTHTSQWMNFRDVYHTHLNEIFGDVYHKHTLTKVIRRLHTHLNNLEMFIIHISTEQIRRCCYTYTHHNKGYIVEITGQILKPYRRDMTNNFRPGNFDIPVDFIYKPGNLGHWRYFLISSTLQQG